MLLLWKPSALEKPSPTGPHDPLSLPGHPKPTAISHTYWSGLGHHRDWFRHWDGAGPGGSQVELLGLCDLGLGLWKRGLIGQRPLQLVEQLLDLWLPP